MAAVVMPLPTELTTPPVMKMYLAVMYPQSEGASSPTNDDSGAARGGQGFGGARRGCPIRSFESLRTNGGGDRARGTGDPSIRPSMKDYSGRAGRRR